MLTIVRARSWKKPDLGNMSKRDLTEPNIEYIYGRSYIPGVMTQNTYYRQCWSVFFVVPFVLLN